MNESIASHKIEEGLKKLSKEINPFRILDHPSNWSKKVPDKPETIRKMMKRWNVTLADSKLVNETFARLKKEYFEKVEKGEKKESLVKKHMVSFKNFRISEPQKNNVEGYRNKGYIWFEEGKNFSLKDFIVYHCETSSQQVYDEATVNNILIVTDELIENAPKQEFHFCSACEGYAYAKYIDFLKSESMTDLNKEPITLNSLDEIEIPFRDRVLSVEQKIEKDSGPLKNNKTRCAAFCDLLWDKKYFESKKDRLKTCNEFSKNRYGIDLYIFFKDGKKIERKNHKESRVSGKPSLRSYFD